MIPSEKKVCQNCKVSFVVAASDFAFYEKMNVPPPTWCPECRMMRRTNFRNLRSLYKRECGLCKKITITMYRPDDPAPVYCNPCWWSDQWDPLSYGVDIDWSRPFFLQWYELFKKVPRFALWQVQPLENCEYTNYSINNKNCYLSYSVTGCEDIRYSENIDKSLNCLDNLYLIDSENCYGCIDSNKNYGCRFLVQSHDCIDSWFLFDAANCNNCFMSANIRNKQFVFRGRQLSKDEYEAAVKNEVTGSFSHLEKLQREFQDLIHHQAVHKYADIIASPEATGNHIHNSKNVQNSYGVYGAEDIKHCMRILKECREAEDVYGLAGGELIYDCTAVSYQTYNCAFSFLCNTGISNARYCVLCLSSSNIFGSVGLKKNDYVILNKRYTRDEYDTLVPRIIAHMNETPYRDSHGRTYGFGEYFPPEFSPHFYNESNAFDLYPIQNEVALSRGYSWKEREPKNLTVTVAASNLPDAIGDAPEHITKDVVGCVHGGECDHQCTGAFRVLSGDLVFYKRFDLPLPRLCPNCRHYERLALREPVAIWHRTCMCERPGHHHADRHCDNEFETSYAPDKPDIVYCSACYQGEVM